MMRKIQNRNVICLQDYYPFGMIMPGRSVSAGEYRYGFGGQEMDNEISGTGNSYTAEYWQYDSRLGRRWNVDPEIRPWESPYATFRNNPLYYIDPDGLSPISRAEEFAENEGIEDYELDWENYDDDGTVTLTWEEEDEEGDIQELTKDFQMTSWESIVYNIEQSEEWINNYMKNNSTLQALEEHQQESDSYENFARGLTGLLPPVGFLDGAMVLLSDENIYGEDASGYVDKTIAGMGVLAPMNPGKNIGQWFFGTDKGQYYDEIITRGASFLNNAVLLDGLKD